MTWAMQAVIAALIFAAGGAGVLMLGVMAQHWNKGVPDRFVDSRFLPRQRRKTDR